MKKQEYLELLMKGLEKGWKPKDPLFVIRLEAIPEPLFNEALAKSEFAKKNTK